MRTTRKFALIGMTALFVLSLSIGAAWAVAQEDSESKDKTGNNDPSIYPYPGEGYHFEYDRGMYHAYLINKVDNGEDGSYFHLNLHSKQGPSLSVDMGGYDEYGSYGMGVKANFYGLVEFRDLNDNGEFDPLVDKVVSHVPLSCRFYHLGIVEPEKPEQPEEPEYNKEAYGKGYEKGYDIGYDIGMKLGLMMIEEGIPYTEDPFENMPEEIRERIKALIEEHLDMYQNTDSADPSRIRSFVKGFIAGIHDGIHDGYRDAYLIDGHPEENIFYEDDMTRAYGNENDEGSEKDERNRKEDPDRDRDEDEKEEDGRRRKDDDSRNKPVWCNRPLLNPLEVIDETFTSEGFHLAYQMTDLKELITFQMGIRAYYAEDGSVIPQAGGIRINIAGYPYKARDTQVALIAEGSSHYNERYPVAWIQEDEESETDVYMLDEEEDDEEEEGTDIDPRSLIRHIIPVFVNNEGEVYQPLWQDYHKRIVEEENLWGYLYSEYHLGAFSFTRDQVPPVDKDVEEENPEEEEEYPEYEEEEDPEEIEEEEGTEESTDDTIGLVTPSDDTTSKDAGAALTSTWVLAAGIGAVVAVLGTVALIGILVFAGKR